MKGNEARIVFFLHPVKEVEDGHKLKENQKSILPRLRSLLLVFGTILALGVSAYVLYKFANKHFTIGNLQSIGLKILSRLKTEKQTWSHQCLC